MTPAGYVDSAFSADAVLNADFFPDTAGQSDPHKTSDADFRHGHQGLAADHETGLYYNRARLLHPTLGRFTQRDPLGYVDGMSVYQYVRSGPVGWVDPSGTSTEINFFNEGLAHYYAGGGSTVSWGPSVVSTIKRHYVYLRMIDRMIQDGVSRASCEGGTYDNKDGETEVSFMPHKQYTHGLGTWLGNWNTALLIGTLNFMDAWGRFEFSTSDHGKTGDQCCCEIVVKYSIRVEVQDRYGWDGLHNNGVKYIVVNPVSIIMPSGGKAPLETGIPYISRADWDVEGEVRVTRCSETP